MRRRYIAGESLAALARVVELPPCLLVRRFLELIPELQGLVSAPWGTVACRMTLPIDAGSKCYSSHIELEGAMGEDLETRSRQ